MPTCLFCPTKLDKNTKPEHVLLNALGGRMTTRDAICDDCNNVFGGTIDKELTSQVVFIRNLLQLESGTGKVAPAMKNVQAGNDKINIYGDGRIEHNERPFTIEDLGNGKFNVQIQARSPEHFVQLVPHIAAILDIPENQLREQLSENAQASIISRRPEAVHQPQSFGGPMALRSIVKSTLVLWSTLAGNDEVKGAPYEAARNFVKVDDRAFNVEHIHLDSRVFENVKTIEARFGPIFNLIYVRSDSAGRVAAHFTLYNLIAWQITLAERGGIPNKKIALISNPLKPADWTKEAARGFDVSFEWLASPDYSDNMERSRARFAAVMKHYFETQRPIVIGEIIDQCCKELGLEPNTAIPLEKVQELSRLVSLKVVSHFTGQPYEREVTTEEIKDWLAKK